MTATFALICALLAASQPISLDAIGAATSPVGAANVGAVGYGTPRDDAHEKRSAGAMPATRGAPLTLAGGSPPAVSRGRASWFDARGYQGAVPWWRAGQAPVWATLSRFADGRTYSVTLLITGFCACLAGQPGERLIDLSPAAFRALGASLSVGLIRVTMTVPVQGPRLPATDEEGE